MIEPAEVCSTEQFVVTRAEETETGYGLLSNLEVRGHLLGEKHKGFEDLRQDLGLKKESKYGHFTSGDLFIRSTCFLNGRSLTGTAADLSVGAYVKKTFSSYTIHIVNYRRWLLR